MNSALLRRSSRISRFSLLPACVATLILLTLSLVARDLTTVQLVAAFVTAGTIAVLDWYPIYLDPTGELRLTTVVTLPTLVLFGWPSAVLGVVLGLIAALLHRPPGQALIQATERLGSLVFAAALAIALRPSGPYAEISTVVLAGAGYTLFRTTVVSLRLHSEEAISWSRAVRFLATTTFLHQGVFTAVAAVTVWILENDPFVASRLLGPMLAAGVTLQLYLPRILRGQEQRRVLAAVSVLAAAVDAKDPYTADHSAEVATISRRVARILNLDEPEVHRIYLAGLLHDVGKTIVPTSILLKPDRLTDEEWRLMRSHVEAGVGIVESIEGLADVAPLVAASHEQLDGRGYPRGLRGDEIPLGSRINLVVDAYNALTTDRPYREARSPESALRELERNAGTQFDPRVISALRTALGQRAAEEVVPAPPAWIKLLRQPAFGLLWCGELVSFLGDQVLFIALSLWVYKLTGSITILATTLIAATVGQGALGFFAGVLVDRTDRRRVLILADIGRAAIVAALPLLIVQSIPIALLLLVILNVGTVFFRAAVYALIPSVVPREELPTATALFHSTERIAEVVGGVLGGAIVLTLGYRLVFYLDSVTFLVSAASVALMPVAWRAGLTNLPRQHVMAEIGDGLRYIWQTPLHRALALLIVPGYLTLAFDALQTPMVVKTAGLSIFAYGVINSVLGAGRLVAAIVLTGAGKQWVTFPFTVAMYLLTALAAALFGSNALYPALIVTAFVFGFGNIATAIANTTLSIAQTPSGILGRLIASRQVFIAVIKVVAMLSFGWLADVAGPPFALVTLGLVSGFGVAVVWFWTGRQATQPAEVHAPGETP